MYLRNGITQYDIFGTDTSASNACSIEKKHVDPTSNRGMTKSLKFLKIQQLGHHRLWIAFEFLIVSLRSFATVRWMKYLLLSTDAIKFPRYIASWRRCDMERGLNLISKSFSARPFMFPSRDANPSDTLNSLRCHKIRCYGVVWGVTPLQAAFSAIIWY